jgi:hypothetical protein
MDRLMTTDLEGRRESRRDVHIEEDVQMLESGTSASSARHAAYASACRMSSASR